ncbi:hypothetical protein SAMN05216567_12827 [Variovorax sp. OK605]|uniref:hypothetical protein n=1 Tax=Variovorax sp. OK605 TaxID=1855317 RepID=UPI0008EF4E29|nr:hypothetical protein [Variovorax sp. OK605]SFQ70570.1 hypothetical protein SAMN05216567_12827 [Variovorax sp. OK605]
MDSQPDPRPGVDTLDALQRDTQALVAQRLRSVSAVIARLADAISHAHALGHGHAAIHARLRAGGLAVSWNNYRAGLVRARKRRAVHSPLPPLPPLPPQSLAPCPPPGVASASGPAAGASAVLDALASAQRAASRDYAQAARASSASRKARSFP